MDEPKDIGDVLEVPESEREDVDPDATEDAEHAALGDSSDHDVSDVPEGEYVDPSTYQEDEVPEGKFVDPAEYQEG